MPWGSRHPGMHQRPQSHYPGYQMLQRWGLGGEGSASLLAQVLDSGALFLCCPLVDTYGSAATPSPGAAAASFLQALGLQPGSASFQAITLPDGAQTLDRRALEPSPPSAPTHLGTKGCFWEPPLFRNACAPEEGFCCRHVPRAPLVLASRRSSVLPTS
jgi:hypothetical protein